MTGISSPGCRCWAGWRPWRWTTAGSVWKRSGRSTSTIGRRRRPVRCWLWSRSGICGGELRIRWAQAGVAAAAAGDQDLVAAGGALDPVAELVPEEMSSDGDLIVGAGSGAEGARTPDLCHAMAALSQLSYSPREQVFLGPVYRRPLSILGGAQA